jgi:hypothetical protein
MRIISVMSIKMSIKSGRMAGYGLDSYSSLHEPAMGTCEHCNEPLSATK